MNFKINNSVKSFLISKDLLNYKENILATLSIITNYFEANKLNLIYF